MYVFLYYDIVYVFMTVCVTRLRLVTGVNGSDVAVFGYLRKYHM